MERWKFGEGVETGSRKISQGGMKWERQSWLQAEGPAGEASRRQASKSL